MKYTQQLTACLTGHICRHSSKKYWSKMRNHDLITLSPDHFGKTKNCTDISGKKWSTHFRGNWILRIAIPLFVIICGATFFATTLISINLYLDVKQTEHMHAIKVLEQINWCQSAAGLMSVPTKGRRLACQVSAVHQQILMEQQPMAVWDTWWGESKSSSSPDPCLVVHLIL